MPVRILLTYFCALLSLSCFLLVTCQPVWALEYELKGVEQSKLEDNIELYLNPIKLSNNTLDDPTQERIIRSVKTALQPFGYYNSNVTVVIEDDDLIIDVAMGEPLLVANVTREIIGDGRNDDAFRQRFDAFPLKPGDVLLQPTYEKFKSEMFNYALSNGYFDFHWQATRLDLVREENEANILLIAQSGRQYEFGEVELVGDDRAAAIIGRLRNFTPGEKYSSEKLTEFNRRLNETGYFSRAIARPIVKRADGARVPIEVTLKNLPRDIFNVGGGVNSDKGPRIRARWERPWVNTRGHSVTGQLFLSKLEQATSLDYRIPLQDVNNDYASFQTSYQFEDNSISDTKSETLSVSAHRFWKQADSPWQRSISLSFEREMFTQGISDPQTINLLMPGFSLGYTKADQRLNISHGQQYLLAVQGAQENVGSDISLLKVTANAKVITTINDTHRFYIRASAGAIDTDDFNQVPSSLRFFTGGDQSVRGFRYQEISPKVLNEDGEELLTGGRYLATASVEYSYPVADNWRAAVFVDAGTATNDFADGLSRGLGVGAHWLTLIGPVRFYIARGENDFESQWRFHFSLGPEL